MTRTPLIPRYRLRPLVAVCIFPVLLSACTMSGLGGASDYGCKAPVGVHCDSVSGNYYNAIQNNLPGQRRADATKLTVSGASQDKQTTSSMPKVVPIAGVQTRLAGMPLHSQARIIRLWFKPWEDADHDLYDQGYVYVQIDSGDWLIDHAQQRIRDAYAPIHPPRISAASSAPAAKTGDSSGKDSSASDIPSFSAKPSLGTSEQPASEKP